MPVDPSMEFGGYVEPPSHLNLTSKKNAPEGRPPDLRTIPDYDYSLFRYSKVSLPALALIITAGAVLLGLSFWQGPFGYKRGANGFQDGTPLDFHLQYNDDENEAGMKKSLRSLRCANFVMGAVPLIICIFAIRAQPTPGALKGILLLCAFIFFCLGVCSAVSFALGVDQVHRLKDCPDLTFPTINFSPNDYSAFDKDSVINICWKREQISTATATADICESVTAFVLVVLLIYTTMEANWAWGPGHVPVEKETNRPRIMFPPPSPFTHISSTRRTYVWLAILLLSAFVLIAFILTIIMHELRIKPRQVNFRNQVTFKSGWTIRQNRLRVALAGFTVGFASVLLLDMAGWRRRLIAYIFGTGLFWCSVGLFVCFGMDVNQVSKAGNITCPSGNEPARVKCMQWAYFGTCFVDFALAFILMIFVLWEFLARSASGWSTFYFYADSEWLRNHSLFVDSTDREAFDWKKFVLDSGKEYYYSPSLGISTRQPPKNYVEPEGAFVPGYGAAYPPVSPLPMVAGVAPAYVV